MVRRRLRLNNLEKEVLRIKILLFAARREAFCPSDARRFSGPPKRMASYLTVEAEKLLNLFVRNKIKSGSDRLK